MKSNTTLTMRVCLHMSNSETYEHIFELCYFNVHGNQTTYYNRTSCDNVTHYKIFPEKVGVIHSYRIHTPTYDSWIIMIDDAS